MERARLLDPRPEAEAKLHPIAWGANIPWDELSTRQHELPPSRRAGQIEVANVGEAAARAIEALSAIGRVGTAVDHWDWAPPGSEECFRLWEPNPFLEERLRAHETTAMERGRAIDLACGTGRNAVYLASLGWHVTAIDHLEDALARARDLERRYLTGAPPIDWVRHDLEASSPVQSGFDLIACLFFLHRPLLEWAVTALNPGGSLVVETFTLAHREYFGKPKRESLVLAPGELPMLIGNLRIETSEEGWHEGRHTARLHARCFT
ncbi:MAG: class I SAM-dependent methyltransferase [Fimbriimonas ginsengisoli]|nr:class I SAM-dependent methyltransferase [Fimbriimonas ginsengisoli]